MHVSSMKYVEDNSYIMDLRKKKQTKKGNWIFLCQVTVYCTSKYVADEIVICDFDHEYAGCILFLFRTYKCPC